jgi:PII-like signaling protein
VNRASSNWRTSGSSPDTEGRTNVDDALVRQVRAAGIDGVTLAEAIKEVGGPAPQARATILHLMWTQEIIVDTTQPLTSRTLLRRRTA